MGDQIRLVPQGRSTVAYQIGTTKPINLNLQSQKTFNPQLQTNRSHVNLFLGYSDGHLPAFRGRRGKLFLNNIYSLPYFYYFTGTEAKSIFRDTEAKLISPLQAQKPNQFILQA
jgi:hypothetical protein